jgi:pSer/pThr/pTyr-binding forkhead associated (FHA) protein
MARLVVKAVGLENKVIELKLGSNVIGRSPDCDFQISHPTVSTMHCELLLN